MSSFSSFRLWFHGQNPVFIEGTCLITQGSEILFSISSNHLVIASFEDPSENSILVSVQFISDLPEESNQNMISRELRFPLQISPT